MGSVERGVTRNGSKERKICPQLVTMMHPMIMGKSPFQKMGYPTTILHGR